MIKERSNHAMVHVEGNVYVFGGENCRKDLKD